MLSDNENPHIGDQKTDAAHTNTSDDPHIGDQETDAADTNTSDDPSQSLDLGKIS